MDLIRGFIFDISSGKFKKGLYKINETIKNDERFECTYNWLCEKYVQRGQGIKSIIKDYDLNVGYSFLRRLLTFLGFELHSNVSANNFLRERRSKIAHNNFIMKTGFFGDGVQESIHHKSSQRGIQGYYWNSSLKKYVWLRSSWEFIYAKWLNSQSNIIWDVECEQYELPDNTSYRPDFFIFNKNNEIKKIVEIKGYWKDKSYKVDLLKKTYRLPIVLIDNIQPYCEKTINEEIRLWKLLRKLKLNE